jgi:hypothetical protein
MSSESQVAGQLTLQHFLECEASVDSRALANIVSRAFNIQGKAQGRIDGAANLKAVANEVLQRLFAVWWPRTNFPEEVLRNAVTAEYQRLKVRWSEIEAQRKWRERIAEEKRERQAREDIAENVKKVAERCKVSERQARYMIRDGSTLPDRAKELAEALGGEAVEYLRPKTKPGRSINYVGWFMRPRYWEASFQEFAASTFEGGEDFEAITDARADFADLDILLTFAASVGVSADAARRIWRDFKAWRVQRLYDLAMSQLGEEEEREYDFG